MSDNQSDNEHMWRGFYKKEGLPNNGYLLRQRVKKIGGSFQHTGIVVSVFKTTAGEDRIVLEFDAPVKGMLHVYRPDQVEMAALDV